MTLLRALVTVAAVVTVAAIVGPVTRAYNTYGKWGTTRVSFYVNPANSDVSANAAISALQAAMDVWNTQSGTPFRFSYAGQVSSTSTGYDNKNVAVFRSSSNGGAIASTYAWAKNGYLVDADIIFWDGGFKFFTGSGGCSSGVYVEDVGAHEFGHAMGLSHSGVSEATMNASYYTCSMSQRTLASDDIAGAKKLYGDGGGGGTSTSLDTAPIVTILSPLNGVKITAGTTISFSGSATDTPDGNLSSRLVWRSNIDGQIGTGASFSKALTAGSHTITATVTDSTSHTSSAAISLTSSTTSSATAPTLTATARILSDGTRSTSLAWSGLTSSKVDIYRNGSKVAVKANDGSARDEVSSRGTYTYKVCAEGTSTCTNQASVTY
jgi:hypothetical protein